MFVLDSFVATTPPLIRLLMAPASTREFMHVQYSDGSHTCHPCPQVIGAHILHYLLEKSRIIEQTDQERNYQVSGIIPPPFRMAPKMPRTCVRFLQAVIRSYLCYWTRCRIEDNSKLLVVVEVFPLQQGHANITGAHHYHNATHTHTHTHTHTTQVFYRMCRGAPKTMRDALNLQSDCAAYNYMKGSLLAEIPFLDDVKDFAVMEKSMTDCGLEV